MFQSKRGTVSGYFLAGRFMTFIPVSVGSKEDKECLKLRLFSLVGLEESGFELLHAFFIRKVYFGWGSSILKKLLKLRVKYS